MASASTESRHVATDSDQHQHQHQQPHDDAIRAQDASLVPVTYYPLGTQKQYEAMARRVAGKPYAHYFRPPPLYMGRAAVMAAAVARPIGDATRDVLPLAQARRLLEAGDHAVENGWYVFADGTGYVASKTLFPGCTGDMVDWWFWWHSVEDERYGLWYPHNHCSVRSSYARQTTSRLTPCATRVRERLLPILERDDLPHRHRWLGSVHTVSEFIGPARLTLRIEFCEPDHFGLGSWDDLRAAGYETAVCGTLWDKALPIKLGDMLHLWRRTDQGLELRSRYYIAHDVQVAVGGLRLSIDRLAGLLGLKRLEAGAKVAYEQLLHDQTEFTNLASILPGLYREFGQRAGQGRPTLTPTLTPTRGRDSGTKQE